MPFSHRLPDLPVLVHPAPLRFRLAARVPDVAPIGLGVGSSPYAKETRLIVEAAPSPGGKLQSGEPYRPIPLDLRSFFPGEAG